MSSVASGAASRTAARSSRSRSCAAGGWPAMYSSTVERLVANGHAVAPRVGAADARAALGVDRHPLAASDRGGPLGQAVDVVAAALELAQGLVRVARLDHDRRP